MSTLNSIDAFNYEIKDRLNRNKLSLQKSMNDVSIHVKWLHKLAKPSAKIFIHPLIEENCSAQKYILKLILAMERVKRMIIYLLLQLQKMAQGEGTSDCIILFTKTEKWNRVATALNQKAVEIERSIEQDQ